MIEVVSHGLQEMQIRSLLAYIVCCCLLSQLALLVGRNNVVVAVNGFMVATPTASANANSPAILRICIGGNPAEEVVVKVWGEASKTWVLDLEQGPVLVMGLVRQGKACVLNTFSPVVTQLTHVMVFVCC